jgi:hypothetical protein
VFQKAPLKQVRVPPHRVQAKEVVIVGQFEACYVAASLYASCRVEAAMPEIDEFEAEQLSVGQTRPISGSCSATLNDGFDLSTLSRVRT